MLKRNVKPENEIPLTMLTEESIAIRVASGSLNEMNPKTVEEFKWLHEHINNLAGDVDSHSLLNDIYRVIDVFVENEIKPISVCAKGCSQCCYVPLSITSLEMIHIAEREGIKDQVNTRASMDFLTRVSTRSPCPFLGNDGVCSIYDSRPVACRVFATVDHYKYCYDEQVHEIISFRSSELVDWVLRFLHNASKNALPKFTSYTDIRKWFPNGKGINNG